MRLYLFWIQLHHPPFLALYKVEALLHHLSITLFVWEIRPMVILFLYPLASLFLKSGVYIEHFPPLGCCFDFHICRHIFVIILRDSVSVAWHNCISSLSIPGALFIPNIFKVDFTLLSRSSGFPPRNFLQSYLLFFCLLNRFSVYCLTFTLFSSHQIMWK